MSRCASSNEGREIVIFFIVDYFGCLWHDCIWWYRYLALTSKHCVRCSSCMAASARAVMKTRLICTLAAELSPPYPPTLHNVTLMTPTLILHTVEYMGLPILGVMYLLDKRLQTYLHWLARSSRLKHTLVSCSKLRIIFFIHPVDARSLLSLVNHNLKAKTPLSAT